MFAEHSTATRVRNIPGANYGNGSAHNYARDKCKICTQCAACTGYGANCCECRGKDRSGDKGKECGCGAGASGCNRCGKCETCGGTGHTCTGVMPVSNYTPSATSSPVVSPQTSPAKPPGVSTAPPPGMAIAPPPGLAYVDEWHYKDAQHNVQGPYPTSSMRQWHEAGYFTDDLPLKMTNWKAFHTLKQIFPNTAVAFTGKTKEPIPPPVGLGFTPPGGFMPPAPPSSAQGHPIHHTTSTDSFSSESSGAPSTDAAVNRIVDAFVQDSGAIRSPVAGMFPPHLEVRSLQDALAPILAKHPHLTRSMKLAAKKAKKLANTYGHLTEDERMAIVIYTVEEVPAETSVSGKEHAIFLCFSLPLIECFTFQKY
jgi:hypothetical protein